MSPRDQEIYGLIKKFCIDNAGNRLNEWSIETLLNRLTRIIGRDACQIDKENARQEKVNIDEP
jgi:hypothetical protein